MVFLSGAFYIHGLINNRSSSLKPELGSCSQCKNWKVSARDSTSMLLSPYCQSSVEHIRLNSLVSSGTAQWRSSSIKSATAPSLRFKKMSPTLLSPSVITETIVAVWTVCKSNCLIIGKYSYKVSHKAYTIVYFFMKCLGILTRSRVSSPIVFIQVGTSSNDADCMKNSIFEFQILIILNISHFHQDVNKTPSLIKRRWTLSRLSSHSSMKNSP